jgi:hypothetical protein
MEWGILEYFAPWGAKYSSQILGDDSPKASPGLWSGTEHGMQDLIFENASPGLLAGTEQS